MQTKKIPIKLRKEPLIDVVCGVTLVCDQAIDGIFPGALLKNLDGKNLRFEATPIAGLPQQFRSSNPAFQNAPLMRVVIDNSFVALIGEKSVGVGCQMPYAGWAQFRPMIEIVFKALGSIDSVKQIEKCYLKYVDLLPKDGRPSALERFNIDIKVAGRKLDQEVTTLQSEIKDEPYAHAITIASQATVNRQNSPALVGALINVETSRSDALDVQSFLKDLPGLLDNIHTVNKKFFFDLLSESGLAELEPQYD